MKPSGPIELSSHHHSYVDEVYRILLGRPADAAALTSKADALRLGTWSPAELLTEILNSDEFCNKLPDFLHRHALMSRRGLLNDSTQYGELQILLKLWLNETAVSRYVVDVGARGRDRSNSYDLLKFFGWRGLLVEANPALIETIRQEFSGLDVELAACAVSVFNGRSRLTLGFNDDVSSLEPGSAESWGATRGKVDVSVRRLGDLLFDYGAPSAFDLLSIDIEGEDIRVLNDFVEDGRYAATWVLIEASHDFTTQSLADLPTSDLVRQTYRIAGQTKANLLLRRVGDDRKGEATLPEIGVHNE